MEATVKGTMEPVAAPRKCDINILSNILLSDDTFKAYKTRYSDIPNKEDVDYQLNAAESSEQQEESPVLFRNLAFDLPGPKRKNSFSDKETVKKLKTKSSNGDCGSGSDNEDKIFNYLTGTYETVKETDKEEPLENSIEIKEEKLFDETTLIKEEPEKALVVTESIDDNVSISISDVKDDPIEPLKFEVFDNKVYCIANSQGQLNGGNILKQMLIGTSPQVLRVVNGLKYEVSQSLNHNVNSSQGAANLDKSMLRHYLASAFNGNRTLNGKNSGNVTSHQNGLKQTVRCNTTKPYTLERQLTLEQLWDYKCKSCSYIAKTTTELMSHVHSVHFDLSQNGQHSNRENIVFKCFDCDTIFDERSQLETHALLIHSMSAFKCDDVHLSKEFVKECSKCVYESVLNRFPKSDPVKNLSSRSEHKNCVGRGQTSVLFQLLTENECFKKDPLEASEVKETIVILSDDETLDVKETSFPTENKLNSQQGTSEDNIVVLSDDETLLDCPDDELAPASEVIAVETTGKTSTMEKEVGNILGAVVDVTTNDNVTAAEKMEENNDASEIGRQLNGSHDETDDNNDISQEPNRRGPEVVSSYIIEENNDQIGESRPDEHSDSDDVTDTCPLDQPQDQVETISNKNHRCFDCSYSIVGDLPQFRRHVAKHIGSKFHCMPHSAAKEDDCPKCSYENILNDVEKYIKRCLKCGFVADEASVLEAHIRDDLCDVRCSPGDVKCFHCPYVTSRKKFLYFHAADHVQEGFACDEHSTSASVDACLKCVYEHQLKLAKKDALDCEICGFKSVIMAVFDVHQCNNSCRAPYTCWDCKLDSFSTIDELRQHAVAHFKSGFRCKDHERTVNNCYQCLYQTLADNLEGNVFVCETCDFKSLSEETFGRHTCTGSITHSDCNRKFKCFHCNYKTDNKNLLQYHCKEHCSRSYACADHPPEAQPANDCPKCVYQELLSSTQKSLFVCNDCDFKTFNGFHFKTHTSKSHPTVSDAPLPFQCFDCTSRFMNFRRLKYHAVCHSDSKFKCTDHKSNQDVTCQKCIYENIIRSAKEGTYACKKCDFKTYVWSHMKDHQSDEANCVAQEKLVALKPVEMYSCFDCSFCNERLDFLKVHVKEHCDSKFECDVHNTSNADCPKCRYVKLVLAMTRGRIYCYDCNKPKPYSDLLSLRNHATKEHARSYFACTLHVENNDSSCSRCVYAKVVKDVVGDNYVKLICWDCGGNKLFSRMAPYEEHITYSHVNSTFLCPEHCGKNYKRCSKCLYHKMLQRHSIITPTSKTLTFQCFQCNYSDKQLRIFIRHIQGTHKNSTFKCKDHPNSCDNNECCPQCFYHRIKSETSGLTPFIRCYECDLTNKWSFQRLQFMKSHIKEEHKKCEFVCTLHPIEGGTNCVKCWFEILAQNVTQKKKWRYQCFSCSFGSDNLGAFKSHVHQSHRDTSFKCKSHLSEALIDCPQCFYATIFSEACKIEANNSTTTTNNVIICYACTVNPPTTFPHITALKNHITESHTTSAFICPNHIVKVDNCDKCLFQGQLELIREQLRTSLLQCFDCNYSPAKFSTLRYHVWQQHRNSEYRCKKHVAKTIDCQTCAYVTTIENIKKFTCYACETLPVFSGVDPLRRHVYKAHEKVCFVCRDEHCSSSRNDCGKCLFQKLVRDVFLLKCHDCDVPQSFQDKDCLKQHINVHHVNSKFVCTLHRLGPKWDTCSQCCYEKLLRVSSVEEPRPIASSKDVSTFKCFDCNYETDEDVIMKWHIQKEHSDSGFTCGTHSSGSIDHACSECTYENLVLQVKEHFDLCLSP